MRCDNHPHSTSHRLHAAVTGQFSRTESQWLSARCCAKLCFQRCPLSAARAQPEPLHPSGGENCPAFPAPTAACTTPSGTCGPGEAPLARCRSQAQRRCHSPGVDLQLAGGHVAAGELVHAVVPPIVGGEDAKQQRARLRGEAGVRTRMGMRMGARSRRGGD